MVSEENN